MNILLLGYGFLGRYLYGHLKNKYNLKVYSNNISDNPLEGFYLRDFNKITNEALFDNIEIVVHTIHSTVPATSILNLKGDLSENVFPTLKLLEILSKRNIGIIFISSGGAIYGKPAVSNVTEQHHTNPLSGYGISKLVIEKYIQLYSHLHDLNYLILRPSNLFGPNQNLYKPQGIVGHLLNSLQSNEEIEIWGDGEGKKDYLYVGDLCAAIQLSIQKFEKLKGCIYNVASGFHYSVNEIISIIQSISGNELRTQKVVSKNFDVQDVILDGTIFRQCAGFIPSVKIEDFISKSFL